MFSAFFIPDHSVMSMTSSETIMILVLVLWKIGPASITGLSERNNKSRLEIIREGFLVEKKPEQ